MGRVDLGLAQLACNHGLDLSAPDGARLSRSPHDGGMVADDAAGAQTLALISRPPASEARVRNDTWANLLGPVVMRAVASTPTVRETTPS